MFDIPSWRIESQKDTIEQEQRRKLIKKYEYFLSHEWICESNNSIDLFFQLDAETQSRCNFNVNSINWPIYIRLCCFAIKRHLLNQPVEEFKSTSSDMLSRKTSSYFSDLVWAFSEGKEVEQLKAQELKKYVLSTNSVKHAVANLVETRMKKV